MIRSRESRRDEIIRRILARERNQQPLNATAVSRDDSRLYQAARRNFGSWRRALESAGQNPDAVRLNRTWTKQKVIIYLRRLATTGRTLRRTAVYRKDPGFVGITISLFGSWQKGLEAAGVNMEQYCRQPSWDQDQVVEAILTRAVKREPLGASTVTPTSLKTAAIEYFGSWAVALSAAGLDPKSYIGVRVSKCRMQNKTTFRTRDDVKRALLQRFELGCPLDPTSISMQDIRLFRAIGRLFGRCADALRYAGLTNESP